MYIDVHCHLTGDEWDENGGVKTAIERAEQVGVARMICSGFDLQSSKIACALAETYASVYFCAGFHPSELHKYKDGDLDEIKRLCQHEKCVAVGEIGLDYHFDDNPEKSVQKRLFIEQLRLANDLGLPVVIHSRDAAQDTAELLEEHAGLLQCGGLMHCYSYSAEMTARFEKLGLRFSFGGPATFKNSKKVWESVESLGIENILSETDCPYLTPVPFRGIFPNEPKNIPYIVRRLAELKGVDETQMQSQIEKNAYALFTKLK